MADIILAVHVLLALGLIVFILLQRSDGGALGGLGGGIAKTKKEYSNVSILKKTFYSQWFRIFASSQRFNKQKNNHPQ